MTDRGREGSWGHLGAIWGRLGASCGHLGPFWGVLGHLGGVFGGLGRSWVRLGRLLGHLGGPWVDFCRFKLNRAGWGAELGSILEPNMGTNRHPKRTKIEDKNEDEKRSF